MKKLSVEQIAQAESLRAATPVAETRKERFVKVTFLIATEGTKTEPNYLKALKNELEATNRFNIDISIEGKGKATTALVNKVIRQIDNCNQEYDRVWAVFDKDEFNDFDDAIKLAESKNINCAWSNECFELWLLLHFKEVSTPTGRKDLFEELEQAIRNALHKNNPEATESYEGWYKMYSLKYQHANIIKDRIHPFSLEKDAGGLPLFLKKQFLIEVSDYCNSPKSHQSFEDVIISPKEECYGHNLAPFKFDESNNLMRAASVYSLISELPKERAEIVTRQYQLERAQISNDNLMAKITYEVAIDTKYYKIYYYQKLKHIEIDN